MQYDPLNDGKSLVEYVRHMGNDKDIVDSARVSFANDGRDWDEIEDTKLINFLIRNRHSSPLEHSYVKFHVKCPIYVSNQWRRHRTWPYFAINEVSRRYTDENIEIYIPHQLRQQSTTNRQASEGELSEVSNRSLLREISRKANKDIELYSKLISNGVAREQARMVLPQNLYTRFYVTSNLHNLFHFLTLRQEQHAQEEIREYAKAIGEITRGLFPVAFEAYERVDY